MIPPFAALPSPHGPRTPGPGPRLAWLKALAGVREAGVLIALLLLCGVLAYLTRAQPGEAGPPKFLLRENWQSILEATAPVGIIAIGEALVIVTGGIDLSVGAVMGLSGVVAARLIATGYGPIPALPVAAAVLGGVLVGGLCGFVNGALVVWGRMPPFIATLGMFSAARGLAYYVVGTIIGSFPESYLFLGKGTLAGVQVPVLVMLVTGLAVAVWAARSAGGRHIYALGGSEPATRLSGVSVQRVKLGVYTFAGLMSGLAGVLLTAYLGNAQGNQGETMELDVIAAVVVGGVALTGGEGTVVGALLGALLMRVLRNGLVLQGVQAEYQLILVGFVIWLASVVDTLRRRGWRRQQ